MAVPGQRCERRPLWGEWAGGEDGALHRILGGCRQEKRGLMLEPLSSPDPQARLQALHRD